MITGFGNNVVSALAADITANQTTIQIMPGTGALFSGLLTYDYSNTSNNLQTYAKITLTDAKETVFEICHLTAVNNDILTVIRAQEGTTAKGWSLNDVIGNFATRGSENQFVQIEQLQSGHYISGVAGGTANALTLELPATYFVNGSTDWTLRTPIVVYPTQNNTGAATLQLTMGGRVLGTFKLYKGNKAELVANDILKDVALVCLLDNTQSFFNVSNPGAIYAGLGTAAFCDVQTSKDDVTAGRVLVNGGALALRTVAASGGSGAFTDDCNNLPMNSVSFVYGSAKNSPGFEASVLDFSGLVGVYRTQIAASYSDGGKRVSIRTCNGDNQTWNDWKSILTSDGGSFNSTFKFGRVETLPQEQNQTVLFSRTGPDGTIVSGVELNWYANKVIIGIARNGSDGVQGLSITMNGNNLVSIDPSGNVWAVGNISSHSTVNAMIDVRAKRNITNGGYIEAGVGVYDTPGVRVYSPNNPQPIDLSGYATQNWVLQNFVQSIDLTAPTEVAFRDGWGYPRATDGAAMYNFNMVGGSSNVGNFIIRYTRRLVNNVWYVLN